MLRLSEVGRGAKETLAAFLRMGVGATVVPIRSKLRDRPREEEERVILTSRGVGAGGSRGRRGTGWRGPRGLRRSTHSYVVPVPRAQSNALITQAVVPPDWHERGATEVAGTWLVLLLDSDDQVRPHLLQPLDGELAQPLDP